MDDFAFDQVGHVACQEKVDFEEIMVVQFHILQVAVTLVLKLKISRFHLLPGVTLRCFPDSRFKQEGLSLQFIRPMCKEEAALNALLPAVLLRGSEDHPDLRSITLELDELYGASVSTLVRRVGDYQTVGLYCGFIEDRYAFSGDRVLEALSALPGVTDVIRLPQRESGWTEWQLTSAADVSTLVAPALAAVDAQLRMLYPMDVELEDLFMKLMQEEAEPC